MKVIRKGKVRKKVFDMRSGLSKDILLLLSEGGKALDYIINPKWAERIAGRKYIFVYNNGNGQSEDVLKRSYFYLKRNGFIRVDLRKGSALVSITDKGKNRVAKSSIFNVAELYQKHWDKKWRLASFDIPYGHWEKRNVLRSFLKKMGFVQLHKSVWINPFDCERELGDLMAFLKLEPNEFRLIVAEDIGDASKFRKHFEL